MIAFWNQTLHLVSLENKKYVMSEDKLLGKHFPFLPISLQKCYNKLIENITLKLKTRDENSLQTRPHTEEE